MSKPLSTVCFELARHASEANHELLAYILRMAAGEALTRQADAPTAPAFAGVFDWDVSGDVTHTDVLGSTIFGVDPVSAAHGLPISTYLRAIHPDDVAVFLSALHGVVRTGGAFHCSYRVIQNDRVKWLSAEGHMTRDKSGRPLRLPGVLHDITAQRASLEMPRGVVLN